jgi:elongation factor 2
MVVPRFRQTGEILRVMKDKQRVRNVGVIAHVDHGKTTLTDSLLVEAGLLSAEVAGSARVLDFLEEEQRRGITVKTANISLLYRAGGEAFVVNIVDTPGHVDFAGKVAGALRAIDGAVVVVDAVEEVMAQTETATREALMERVKPVLFVNKVDRLFTELRLSPNEMQEKLVRIVRDFNSLIEVYGEPTFREKWKVNPSLGSVVFGSALHRWGFSLTRENPNMFDRAVLNAYQTGAVRKLPTLFPLSRAILDMVVNHVPSPAECQPYRIPRIWKGDLKSEVGKAMLGCDEAGPLVVSITKVQIVDGGLVATGRVFSGSVKPEDKVFLVTAERESKVKQTFVWMGAFREAVDAVGAGNIVGLEGVEGARAGETLVDARFSRNVAGFESSGHVAEPVMTVALEPQSSVDLERLANVLERLVFEDPSLMTAVDTETGQYLLSGIGELHLEVALSFLRKYAADLNVSVSKPIVAYRETVMGRGRTALVKSLNKANSFHVKVEQLEHDVVDALNRDDARIAVSQPLHVNPEQVWAVDKFKNVLVVSADGLNVMRDGVVRGFIWACRSGPLCMEPLRGVKVVVSDAHMSQDTSLRDSVQIMRAVSRGILGSCLSAGMVLLEPVYRVDLRVPVELFGKCVTGITKRRGKIKSRVQRAGVMEVSGFVPVAETFGLTSELRSASSGRAFWQFTFDRWEKVPEDLAAGLVKKLRERKGLAPEVPSAETFVDELR